MNILILGTGEIEQTLIDLCLKSKLLDKIYTASSEPLENVANIEYTSFEDLCYKAKALQIDITLVANKDFIQEGIVEFFRTRMLNIISVNKKWFNLERSRLIAKQLMNHYSINNPDIIKAPMVFPVVIRTNNSTTSQIAYSMQELIKIRETLDDTVFLEDYLDGKIYHQTFLWDGRSVINFAQNLELTEVQEDRFNLFKTKLSFMLSDEKADFNGFFTTKLIWAKNDWYVLDFIMHIDKNAYFENPKYDFIYLLNAVIYQKLNEIQL